MGEKKEKQALLTCPPPLLLQQQQRGQVNAVICALDTCQNAVFGVWVCCMWFVVGGLLFRIVVYLRLWFRV